MPVNLLLVEGDLDMQILRSTFSGSPLVQATKAGKYSLLSRTRYERERGKVETCYLRDRDFDFEPGDDDTPTPERKDNEQTYGWRWRRHAIESYLLEPVIVAEALGLEQGHYEELLVQSARDLRCYTAARWTIGLARQTMPPSWELETAWRKKGFSLPDAEQLHYASCRDWMLERCAQHLSKVGESLAREKLAAVYDAWCERLNSAEYHTPVNILLYYSGKDLMARVAPQLNAPLGAGEFCNRLRDWMIEHPDPAMDVLPEWRKLKDILNAYPAPVS